MNLGGAPARLLRRRPHPVWGLNAAVLLVAGLLYAGPVHALPPLAEPHLPWELLAAMFAAAELCVVHLHFRRGALSFSLGDVPLVFGLLFAGAHGLLAGCLFGSAIVLRLARGLPPIKFIFNLAQWALATCIALLVAHALAPVGAPSDPRTWLAVLAATEAGDCVTVFMIAGAIFLSERQMRLPTLWRMLLTDSAMTFNNTCLGLCAAVLTAVDASALPLFVVPLGTLVVAYRAYLSEHERQKQLEFMHEANRTLTGTGEIVRVVETLLEGSLQAFRAEMAQLVLFGQGDEPPRLMALGPGSRRELMRPIDPDLAETVRFLVAGHDRARLLRPATEAPELAAQLGFGPVTQAMIAPLAGEEHLIGAILLANRLGVAADFDRDELMLLDALATNTSVALQNERLEQAVAQLSVAHQELHHAASHDSLTGLVNRSSFNERVRASLAEDPLAVALLFVDLDNFKTVNDTFGHARGDELLNTVASRLRSCVRGDDVVARLGGDEFALLVRAPGIIDAAAISVAERIIRTCRVDVGGEGISVLVHASVGVAICHAEETDAPSLIHAADLAMYRAKTSGKGRYALYDGDEAGGEAASDTRPAAA